MSLLEGKRCKHSIHLKFLKGLNIPQKTGDIVVFAFDTKLKQIVS
jgi:hypothetical protein